MRIQIHNVFTIALIWLLVSITHANSQTQPRESSGYIPVENINTLPGQSGFIDGTGRFILRQLFEATGPFKEGLADVKVLGSGRPWGYIDISGKMVIQPQFDQTDSFSEGLAAVKIDCKWGYINKTGALVIATRFDEAYQFSDGVALVKTGDQSGYIDKGGRFTFKLRSDWSMWEFCEGLARIQVSATPDPLWGYLNKAGKIVIKPQYHHAENFSEGLAPVSRGGWWHSQTMEWWGTKYGYIDKNGKEVIPFGFDFAGEVRRERAKVN